MFPYELPVALNVPTHCGYAFCDKPLVLVSGQMLMGAAGIPFSCMYDLAPHHVLYYTSTVVMVVGRIYFFLLVHILLYDHSCNNHIRRKP